jgi:glucose-6-phosphate-specific signal transduction histidine kinase
MARPAFADASERLLEALPDAIVMVGMDGQVVHVNRQAELLSGYTCDEPNVGRHGSAATCRLSLRGEPGFAVLEIDDGGQGFVPGEGGAGWGMSNLGERAAAMGGSLDVASVPGEGTPVRLRIPV